MRRAFRLGTSLEPNLRNGHLVLYVIAGQSLTWGVRIQDAFHHTIIPRTRTAAKQAPEPKKILVTCSALGGLPISSICQADFRGRPWLASTSLGPRVAPQLELGVFNTPR